jgi:hypothetical protein
MENEKHTTKNAIPLDDNWEAYWVDKEFGWMIRCRKHPNAEIIHTDTPIIISDKQAKACTMVHNNPRPNECACMAPNEIWKKLLFLDKLAKL